MTNSTRCTVALLGLLVAAGCAGGPKPTRFTNPRFDFGFVERVAVLPFENLSNDRQAGPRATRLMLTELLATGALDVVEPGEVRAALDDLGSRGLQPSTEEVQELGERLGVQALVLGTVTESEVVRSGSVGIPVVGLEVRMVETETGAIVWAATYTERGGSLGARILGTSGQPISLTTRDAVRGVLRTLVEG